MSESGGANAIAEAQKRALEIAAKITAGGGAYSNGGEDGNRKRTLDDTSGEGPDTKKAFTDGLPYDVNDPKFIAQAAISKITGQLGLQGMTIEIKIPNRLVGLIIGRSGEMINKLQADSGAKIQVAPDGSEINGERQVSISGSPDTVEKAKSLVNSVIEDAGGITSVATQMNLEPGQEIVELMIPANKVGLIIGKGGEMIKMLQERAGCKMQMIQDGPYASTPEKPLRMTGFAENCKKARQLVLELMDQKELERQQSGVKPRIELPDPQGPQVQTVGYSIPANKCGLIIGKGGDTIRQLMVQSNCFIELDRGPSPNPQEKLFNIKGHPQNIQLAQQLIRQKIEGGGIPGIDPYSTHPALSYAGMSAAAMYQQGMQGGSGQGGAGGQGNPWGQYYGGSYPGYGGAGGGSPGQQSQQQPSNAEAAQAWAAYYQQLQAYAQQQGGAGTGQGQSPQQGGTAPSTVAGQQDLQAQWAEYYRQMGYMYGQQQQQAPPGPQQHTPPNNEQKEKLVATVYE